MQTLVDVFAVIGVLVGVQLQLNLGGMEIITRAEPRFGQRPNNRNQAWPLGPPDRDFQCYE